MATTVFSCQVTGMNGYPIEVEVDIISGMAQFSIVGLGDAAVQEAKERVRSAIKNAGFEYPRQKKVINLAPADLRKHGPHYDLPIAVGLLVESGQIPGGKVKEIFIAGELALDGSVRPVTGVLTMAITAKKKGIQRIIVPTENVMEASNMKGIEIVGVNSLQQVKNYFQNGVAPDIEVHALKSRKDKSTLTFDDIQGNEGAKRALEIAAAGGHHVILTGPPGVGKTVLAKATGSILPPLTHEEKIEVMQIHSTAGLIKTMSSELEFHHRPFRQVHPSCTQIALIGGGSQLHPGEISLAHRGVLFMDELPEFPRAHLESLRQPLEDKQIQISRARGTITYPSQFVLIASMNPCPCGYFGDPHKSCICKPYTVMQYQRKLSGPLLNRIDLIVEVERQPNHTLQASSGKTHMNIQKRVAAARALQTKRFKSEKAITTNSEMNTRHIKKFCPLTIEIQRYLQQANEKLHLSGRQYYQIIKIARTIADLESARNIQVNHVAEALQYRLKTTAVHQ